MKCKFCGKEESNACASEHFKENFICWNCRDREPMCIHQIKKDNGCYACKTYGAYLNRDSDCGEWCKGRCDMCNKFTPKIPKPGICKWQTQNGVESFGCSLEDTWMKRVGKYEHPCNSCTSCFNKQLTPEKEEWCQFTEVENGNRICKFNRFTAYRDICKKGCDCEEKHKRDDEIKMSKYELYRGLSSTAAVMDDIVATMDDIVAAKIETVVCSCGSVMPKTASFCSECGKALTEPKPKEPFKLIAPPFVDTDKDYAKREEEFKQFQCWQEICSKECQTCKHCKIEDEEYSFNTKYYCKSYDMYKTERDKVCVDWESDKLIVCPNCNFLVHKKHSKCPVCKEQLKEPRNPIAIFGMIATAFCAIMTLVCYII